MAEEPSVNISGGQAGGGRAATFDRETAETTAEWFVDLLGELYWQKEYGGQVATTCLVRTILSQNTSDEASQPAHDALLDRYGDADDLLAALAEADRETLASVIRPAGLHNQKAKVLIDAAAELLAEFGSAAAVDRFVADEPRSVVRDRLLEITGVGPKTADCVLLFAGGKAGVFPVDTHVHRIYRRAGIAPPSADHETVREILEREVPPEKCGFGHTASIQFGREYCTARGPACLADPDACPAADRCAQIGIDRIEGAAVDPAEVEDG